MNNTELKSCTSCGSENTNYVRFIMANGRTQLRTQCFDCGLMPSLNYKHSMVPDISKIPLVNDSLRDKFYDKVIKRSELKKEMFLNGESYYRDIYLNSEEWKSKRKHIIKRDNGKCVICENNKELNVHHITYRRVYKEPAEHLITLCRDCHSDVHSEIPVIKDGLKYNYGKLKVCQNCKKLNNGKDLLLCNSCYSKNIGLPTLSGLSLKAILDQKNNIK